MTPQKALFANTICPKYREFLSDNGKFRRQLRQAILWEHIYHVTNQPVHTYGASGR